MGGLANTKSKRIKNILVSIKAQQGEISLDFMKKLHPDEVARKLLAYPGVGMKTARCVQLFSLGQAAFPVDTHVHRVTMRLGLIPQKATRNQAHENLGNIVPEKNMYSFHINLVNHGKKICRARNPMCSECPLSKLCPRVGLK